MKNRVKALEDGCSNEIQMVQIIPNQPVSVWTKIWRV